MEFALFQQKYEGGGNKEEAQQMYTFFFLFNHDLYAYTRTNIAPL